MSSAARFASVHVAVLSLPDVLSVEEVNSLLRVDDGFASV